MSASPNTPHGAAPVDPWPQHMAPMFALADDDLPRHLRSYAFEFKWDGVRAILYHHETGMRLLSRNQIDITHRYPELEPLGSVLQQPAILDGEIVALDARGRPDFALLQRRMHVSNRRTATRLMKHAFIVYMIFDVLYYGTRLRIGQPYRQRRTLLEQLSLDGPHWKTPPAYPGRGTAVLRAARNLGLEGIIAKQLSSPYRPGQRSNEWLKIKFRPRQEFVIGGWVPMRGVARPTIGALLVGYYEGDKLLYAGSVGSGFTDKIRSQLTRALKGHAREDNPFADKVPPGARFNEPVFVAEVEFAQWTPGGSLRQPVFKGLRQDKHPREVVRE